MIDKFARFKLLLLFGLFALPAALLATLAWILSINTPYFKSLGQVLLTLILLIPLLGLTGYLILMFIKGKYLRPLELITSAMQSILSRNYKPIPEDVDLGEFKQINIMLTQLQNELNQNQGTANHLSQFSMAQSKLFETSLMEITDPVILLNLKMEVVFINNAAQAVTGIKRIDAVGHSVDRVIRFYNKQNAEILASEYIPKKDDPSGIRIFSMSEVKMISNINQQSFADRLIEKVEELEETAGTKELTIDDIPEKDKKEMIKLLEQQMQEAASLLDFEQAAKIRDQIKELSSQA